jgi:flagellar protein FlbD
MIRLSRLDHQEIAINSDLIEYVEAKPDTTVRLVTGDSILVLESVDEVIRRIVSFRRMLLGSSGLAAVLTSGWRPTAPVLRSQRDGSSGEPDVTDAETAQEEGGR